MKTNWQTKKLGEICDIEIGKTPSRSNKKLWDIEKTTKNVWLSIRDLSNAEDGIISDSREYVSDKAASSLSLVEKGTLLVSFKLTLGRLAFAGKDLYTNEAIAALNIKDEKEISREYLYQYLSYFDWDAATKGDVKVKGKTLNKAKLKEIEIVYPPLPEQKRIVKTLDETFKKLEKAKEITEKNLRNSKELFDSYLQGVFNSPNSNWKEKRLEELGQITSSKRIYKKEYVTHGIPFYRIKEIKELAHDKKITIELYISKDRYKEIKNIFGIPKEGDILMTAVGTIGEIYVVKKDEEFYFKDGNILWFKNFDTVDPNFLKYALISFVEQINNLSKGSAYSALTIEKIEKHKIFIPTDIKEQKSIVKKLDHLSEQTKNLELIYQKKISAIEELKRSILSKAFSKGL
ncbi:MAG: restriction endonuclease subunit S [Candidatus Paceibacterota bacterium]|jgi:type I restriction enzyme S subunit